MASATYYCTTADGGLAANQGAYATALTTASTADAASAYHYVGQITGFTLYELLVAFDLSQDPAAGTKPTAGATINSAVLSVNAYDDETPAGEPWTLEAYAYDWTGSGLTTADWRAGGADAWLDTEYDAGHLLGHYAVTEAVSTGVYLALTSDSHMTTAVANAVGGTLGIVYSSSLIRLGTQPTDRNRSRFYTSAQAGQTTYHPKLVIDWSAGVSVPTLTAVQSGANISVGWS